jgi:hypothetical protein
MAFLKSLEIIIKMGTVFENQILEDYIVPILISIVSLKVKNETPHIVAKAVSILI